MSVDVVYFRSVADVGRLSFSPTEKRHLRYFSAASTWNPDWIPRIYPYTSFSVANLCKSW